MNSVSVDINEAFECRRWDTAMQVLSLHGGVVFWEEMGLLVDESELLRSAAERAVSRLRDIDEMSGLDESMYDALRLGVVDSTLRELDESSGPNTRNTLVEWLNAGAFGRKADSAQSFLWSSAWFAANERNISDLELQPNKRKEILRVISEYSAWKVAFMARVRVASEANCSDWDNEVKVNYTEDCSPYDWVLSAGFHSRFVSIWGEIEALLTCDEIGKLREWTARLGESRGIDPALIQMPFARDRVRI
jgi:hypothetical protein